MLFRLYFSPVSKGNCRVLEGISTSSLLKRENIDIRGGFSVWTLRAPQRVRCFRSRAYRPEHTGNTVTSVHRRKLERNRSAGVLCQDVVNTGNFNSNPRRLQGRSFSIRLHTLIDNTFKRWAICRIFSKRSVPNGRILRKILNSVYNIRHSNFEVITLGFEF